MNIIKHGFGLLFLLTISCNSDDNINKKKKLLVKEIVSENLRNNKSYKENTFIRYNKNSLITSIKSNISYTGWLWEGGYFHSIKDFEIIKNQVVFYKQDTLIDKIVINTGSIQEIKRFHYNDLNQISSIEESNTTTQFKYNNLGQVDEIKIIDKRYSEPLSVENILYDGEGNILRLFHNENSTQELGNDFFFELDNNQHSFVHTNINLSIYDELRQQQGIWMSNFTMSRLLYNFEYVYKGKKSIRKIKSPIYSDSYETIETNGDLISFYYRKHSYLPDIHVYYKYY